MSKLQRVWFWLSIVLFVLPEILWSPVGNFLYSFFMPTIDGSSQIWRNSFILGTDFASLYKIILLIQSAGVILFIINWLKFKDSFKLVFIYWLVLVLSTIIGIATLFTVFLAYVVSNISFP